MNAKHTPGPWHIKTERVMNGYKMNITTDFLSIGVCYGSTNPMWDFVPGAIEGDANARLIAASPDLLNALKVAESMLLALEYEVGGGDDEINVEPAILTARAAIAKATGGAA